MGCWYHTYATVPCRVVRAICIVSDFPRRTTSKSDFLTFAHLSAVLPSREHLRLEFNARWMENASTTEFSEDNTYSNDVLRLASSTAFSQRLKRYEFRASSESAEAQDAESNPRCSTKRSATGNPGSNQELGAAKRRRKNSPARGILRGTREKEGISEASVESTATRTRSKLGTSKPIAGSVSKSLPHLPDVLVPNMHILFVGINPGISTSLEQAAYAHPSNRFYSLLHSSGITPDCRHPPHHYRTVLPEKYKLGFTNLCARPTKDAAGLGQEEQRRGVAVIEEKVRAWRPEVVCAVGKGVWEPFVKVRRKKKKLTKDEVKYGWQEGEMGRIGAVDGEWEGASVFVAASTSGLSASLLPKEKEAIWKQVGDWVQQRRREEAGTNMDED